MYQSASTLLRRFSHANTSHFPGGIRLCQPANEASSNPVNSAFSDPFVLLVLKIHLVAAARPNFMKVAPLYHALKASDWAQPKLVHTGQHYDVNMSDVFFQDLALPRPDHHLGVGSGTHAEQTGGVMIAYEKACQEDRPDWIIVVGDVNSTAACAQVGAKMWIPVVHLEAGLRSGDRRMPEEINRLVTDAIADVLWTPSADADENLLAEGGNHLFPGLCVGGVGLVAHLVGTDNRGSQCLQSLGSFTLACTNAAR